MSNERDVTRIVRSWLEEGATALPDRVLDNVLDRLPATHQRRPWWSVRKVGEMNTPIRIAVAVAAVLVVALIGLNVIPRLSSVGGPSPTTQPNPSPSSALRDIRLLANLEPGTYRVADPFAIPFTVTFASQWTSRTLAERDVTFAEVDPANPTTMHAAWLKVNLVDSVYADPCNTGAGLAKLPVPTTVDGTVTAITAVKGFAHGAVTDVVVGGHVGKHFILWNSIDDASTSLCTYGGLLPLWTWDGGPPTGAGTNAGAVDEIWVIDVGGQPLVIDGETGSTYSLLSYPKELQTIVSTMTFGP